MAAFLGHRTGVRVLPVLALILAMSLLGQVSRAATVHGSAVARQHTAPPLSKQLGTPYDIEIGRAGRVYVSDWGYNRILEFSPAGKHVAQILKPRGVKLPPAQCPCGGPTLTGFLPQFLATDGAGRLWVTANRHQVLEYSPSGKLLRHWVVPGALGIALDQQGNVYISQSSDIPSVDGGIVKFSSTGKRLARWDAAAKLSGTIHHLVGLALDGAGNIYVADFANDRVVKMSPTGNVIGTIGPDIPGYSTPCQCAGGTTSDLLNPLDVELDSGGNIYINDAGRYHHNQVKVSPSGTFLKAYPNGVDPGNLAIDSQGNLYIASGNVIKESPAGQVLATWR